jgi:hypothetical protein
MPNVLLISRALGDEDSDAGSGRATGSVGGQYKEM